MESRYLVSYGVSSVEFARVILSAVQDAKNNDVPTDDTEEDFVGKAVGENAAKPTVVKREAFGISFQPQKGFSVVSKEFITQSGASLFISVVRAAEVGLGLGADGDVPIHRRDSRS